MIKFEVGEKVNCRSTGDWDCVFQFEVAARTAKTVTFKYFNDLKTVKIRINENSGYEYAFPLGLYSGAALVSARQNVFAK